MAIVLWFNSLFLILNLSSLRCYSFFIKKIFGYFLRLKMLWVFLCKARDSLTDYDSSIFLIISKSSILILLFKNWLNLFLIKEGAYLYLFYGILTDIWWVSFRWNSFSSGAVIFSLCVLSYLFLLRALFFRWDISKGFRVILTPFLLWEWM